MFFFYRRNIGFHNRNQIQITNEKEHKILILIYKVQNYIEVVKCNTTWPEQFQNPMAKLYGVQIFCLCAYLLKGIPESRSAH